MGKPARVMVQPVQVGAQPVSYIEQEKPYYQPYRSRGWHGHHHHRRNHHHDDDD